MIVVIEGMDAAGKATHSKLLAEKLGGTRFPFPNYDSPTGEAILQHLKKEWRVDYGMCSSELDAMVFQCLQTANRLEIMGEIKLAIAKGPVIFDRYWQSAVVYGGLDGLDLDWLLRVQRDAMPPADVNILIDVPVEEGFKRRPERRDRYESDRAFLEKVRIGYLKLWEEQNFIVVDGLGTIAEVQARILAAVQP